MSRRFCANIFGTKKIGTLKEIAKQIYRSREFYDARLYQAANEIFSYYNNALELLFPHRFVFSEDFPAKPTAEILGEIEDDLRNPFVKYLENEAELLLAKKVKLLGISVCNFSQALPAFTLANALKKKDKGVFIVIGGSWVTDEVKRLKELDGIFEIIDGIIPFEGEFPMLKLIDHLEAGAFQLVPNLIYKKGRNIIENEVERYQPREQAFPVFNQGDLKKYFSPRPVIPIQASEGCKWARCVFCNMHRCYGAYREKNIDYVLREMEFQKKRYQTEYFQFTDLSLDTVVMEKIGRGIRQKGLKVYWSAMTRIDPRFTLSYCKNIYSAGCRVLGFGVESFSDKILKLMNKGFNAGTWRRVIRNCHAAGLNSMLFFLVGFPGEKQKEAAQTLKKIKNLGRIIYSAIISVFGVAPGSIYAGWSKKQKIKKGIKGNQAKKLKNEFDGKYYEEIFGSKVQFPSIEPLLLYASYYDTNDMEMGSIEKMMVPSGKKGTGVIGAVNSLFKNRRGRNPTRS